MLTIGLILIVLILIFFFIDSNNSIPESESKKKYEDIPAILKPPSPPKSLKPSNFKDSFVASIEKPPKNSMSLDTKTFTPTNQTATVLNKDLYMTASYSQNKEWFIATTPSHYESNNLIKGKYYTKHNNKFSLLNSLINPRIGVIANNGSHAIADDLDRNRYSSAGNFHVFSASGESLIKKKIRDANILYIGISSNSDYAFCQTCNGDIYFFDLEKKRQCRHVECALQLHDYRIDEENKRIITYFQGGEYRYHFQGNLFIDGNSYLEDALLLQRDYPFDNEKVLKLLLNAENNIVSPTKEILLLKFLGETYYRLNNIKKAIFYLELAYKENPKCGVKKLLNQINKLK